MKAHVASSTCLPLAQKQPESSEKQPRLVGVECFCEAVGELRERSRAAGHDKPEAATLKKKKRQEKKTYIESFCTCEAFRAPLPHAGELLSRGVVVLHAVAILVVPDRGHSSRRRRRGLSSSGRSNLSRLLRGLALTLILLVILQPRGLGWRRLGLRGRGSRRRGRVERGFRHGAKTTAISWSPGGKHKKRLADQPDRCTEMAKIQGDLDAGRKNENPRGGVG